MKVIRDLRASTACLITTLYLDDLHKRPLSRELVEAVTRLMYCESTPAVERVAIARILDDVGAVQMAREIGLGLHGAGSATSSRVDES